jgi:aspartyl-tRNA(Asn)/glutamyl-tRNA(Gln) amidotransferase subunit A
MGTTIRRGHVADTTATVIERLDAAGAVDVGRLAMVEFALGITGHNAHTGTPRNAWGPARITGGSTSGGATAVAARLVPATLGSDTGGSIRVPAALCGITGIKPTYGRVSRAGAMPLSFSLDHVGPLARSAEDLALLLEVIAGHDPRDPSTSRRPVPRWHAALGPGIEGLRVAVPRGSFDVAVDPSVEALLERALAVLRRLGAKIVERPLPAWAPLNALRRAVMLAEVAALHRPWVAARQGDYNPTTLARMWPGFALHGTSYVRALAARGPLTRTWCREVFATADILALPVTPIPTPTIAEGDTGGDERFVALSNLLGGLIGPFNYLGLPALATPMGFDAAGMPQGLQLVGRPFDEATILRAAHAFERATGWLDRRPPGP